MQPQDLMGLAFRRNALTAGVAITLCATGWAGNTASTIPGGSHAPAPHGLVDTCNDDASPGSLRSQVMAAADGDTIDLSQLSCSTITLGAAIQVGQNSLTLQGPGSDALTIDAGHHSRVIEHLGTGTLTINDLAFANGYHVDAVFDSMGGCIYSKASVTLVRSTISHCLLAAIGQGHAKGGGLYAQGDVALEGVTISDSHAIGASAFAQGGGVYARQDFAAKYSTVSNNSAYGDLGIGGGIYDQFGNVFIQGSTVSENRADFDAGINLASQLNTTAQITNSTISGNLAAQYRGGISTSKPLKLYNSTIAFNHSKNASNGAGLYSNESLTLESSIIADNVAGSVASDLGGNGALVTGDHNLITSSSVSVPFDTIHNCPGLDLLADNGGTSRTHALGQASAAIDQGSNHTGLAYDQRLEPRVVGAHADIGAFERQPTDTTERVFVNGFDGLCDQ